MIKNRTMCLKDSNVMDKHIAPVILEECKDDPLQKWKLRGGTSRTGAPLKVWRENPDFVWNGDISNIETGRCIGAAYLPPEDKIIEKVAYHGPDYKVLGYLNLTDCTAEEAQMQVYALNGGDPNGFFVKQQAIFPKIPSFLPRYFYLESLKWDDGKGEYKIFQCPANQTQTLMVPDGYPVDPGSVIAGSDTERWAAWGCQSTALKLGQFTLNIASVSPPLVYEWPTDTLLPGTKRVCEPGEREIYDELRKENDEKLKEWRRYSFCKGSIALPPIQKNNISCEGFEDANYKPEKVDYLGRLDCR
ncbi:hypothetical protein ABW20_dc0110276 [Dactylellina cionopaga]|nr:hypothetical protein ABW20_dc0110276 [Dactylellina cionopaga]